MNFASECKEYLSYLKKYMYVILSIYLLSEIAIFIKIGRSNVFMFASTIFVTLFMICSIVLSFKDFKTTVKMYILTIPMIPLILYLFFRLNMTWIGTGVYWLYFFIFIINAFRALKENELDFSRISIKNGRYKKVVLVYLILIILALISSLLSINKLESFNLIGISLLSMIIVSLSILSYKNMDEDFIKTVIAYLCIGVTLSSIPDIVVALYSIVFLGKNQHLYGVLGSNFMLGYTIMVLPFILLFSINKNMCKKYNKIFILLLLIQTINLSTQMSRGILLAVFICFVFTMILDKKNFIKYLLVGAVIFSGLGYNVTHRWEFNEIRQEIETEGIEGVVQGEGIFKKLMEQTKSRRPIWTVALGMINDKPYLGVGPGQFKNYYLQYGGKPSRMYIDAHNIILNVATEVGLIFTLVLFLGCITVFFKSLVFGWKKKKYKNILYPGLIGIIALFAYGNITGQAFITSTYPVSIVPAFVFIIIYTILMKTTTEFVRE
ncbi:O-antigen ligase family protein [Clostridium ganghwense]|uniref:O-antigen ligase family protein n=1 Tax=Clostridium ganghwense TaxID=312089 RepID=A0ABT4CQZ6_9CLOT|nr:O-antigen ligase family protein [Clostridium ganghwense]MCY6370501.1 O-antigen ligase family protein [Clostridium ganghwense]